jgi:hypothetical protein
MQNDVFCPPKPQNFEIFFYLYILMLWCEYCHLDPEECGTRWSRPMTSPSIVLFVTSHNFSKPLVNLYIFFYIMQSYCPVQCVTSI